MSRLTIYATIIVVFCLYIISVILARLWDRSDVKRVGVNDTYYYEVIVFTGNRQQAGTDSRVRMVVTGDLDETEVRVLHDSERKVFRHGGMDSFVMAVRRPLGNLSWLRICVCVCIAARSV